MKALVLAAALTAIAGPALPRAAGFDAPSYGDGCRGSCPNYYADADPTIGSGDTQYNFWGLVYSRSPSLQHWTHRNPALVDRSTIVTREQALRRYGREALRDHPSAWGYYVRVNHGHRTLRPLRRPAGIGQPFSNNGGKYADPNNRIRGDFLPRQDAPEPHLPCGAELEPYKGAPALYEWMEAQCNAE